ncbi:MAG: aspartyl-tRNA(Asn)/glutamyl-tRNA(Gln) amidotransferase subunit [Solirubrobacteraceae bacterium]
MTATVATDPADLGVLDAAALLRARALSAVELLEACQARIAARNGGEPSFDGAPDAINAWVRLYPELAVELARAADDRLAADPESASPLCGIPLALKDLFAVSGLPVTASSRVLDGNVADADSAAWRRLRERGMVLLGHTHTHEFAAGGTCDQVGNPWSVDRTAGGSSGGSAAALAAGMAPAAVGTDTAGSVRIPAALSGVSSIKATYGRVPDDGCIPLAPSLDHVGPMARTVADCVPLMVALATEPGAEPDPAIAALPVAPRPGPRPLEGVRIAITDRPDAVDTDADVLDRLDEARRACERLGAEVVELAAAPDVESGDSVTIMFHDVWRYHSGLVASADRYRESIREFVDLARRVHDPAAFEAAQQRRAAVTEGWRAWFADHRIDALLEPTVPMTAPVRGDGYDPGHLGGEGDPLIAFTATWNFTRFPVVTLCAGAGARSGLPVGASLIGPPDAEPVLVQVAIDLQSAELPPPRPPAW